MAREYWDPIRRYSALGLEMGVAVLIGYLVGAYLDRRFHKTPFFTLLFVLCGIVAGFRDLVRAARHAMRDDAQAASKGTDDDPSDKR